MTRLTENKIVLVTRKTRLEDLISRYNTVDQARFYIEHLGADFDDYLAEDRQYQQSLATVEGHMATLGRVLRLERAYVANFVFGPEDTVIVIGQDGLVANTLKYLDQQPVVAVNPDPARWDGVLLPFTPRDVGRVVKEVFTAGRPTKEITMALASLPDGRKLYAVNDLFIGPRSHTSARYVLESGGDGEVQSSSGVIVSTGLGSTGWLKSVLAGAAGLNRRRAEILVGLDGNASSADGAGHFAWSADYLCYSVREPFPSRTTGTELVLGRVDAASPLVITSLMPGHGVIFSDGVESDFLEFNAGQKATIAVADKKGHLVI